MITPALASFSVSVGSNSGHLPQLICGPCGRGGCGCCCPTDGEEFTTDAEEGFDCCFGLDGAACIAAAFGAFRGADNSNDDDDGDDDVDKDDDDDTC